MFFRKPVKHNNLLNVDNTAEHGEAIYDIFNKIVKAYIVAKFGESYHGDGFLFGSTFSEFTKWSTILRDEHDDEVDEVPLYRQNIRVDEQGLFIRVRGTTELLKEVLCVADVNVNDDTINVKFYQRMGENQWASDSNHTLVLFKDDCEEILEMTKSMISALQADDKSTDTTE